MSLSHQATAVAINGRALMIEGPSASGKSSLALALIDRGAMLIGDDSLLLGAESGRLIARPHPNTRGLLEVRGLGLLPFPVCDEAPVALVLKLAEDAPRYIEQPDATQRGGVDLPLITLRPGAAVLHIAAELALERFGLDMHC